MRKWKLTPTLFMWRACAARESEKEANCTWTCSSEHSLWWYNQFIRQCILCWKNTLWNVISPTFFEQYTMEQCMQKEEKLCMKMCISEILSQCCWKPPEPTPWCNQRYQGQQIPVAKIMDGASREFHQTCLWVCWAEARERMGRAAYPVQEPLPNSYSTTPGKTMPGADS